MLISTITGVAPVNNTEFAVAANVRSGIITSSPVFICKAVNERCKAAVALETPIAYLEPQNLAIFFSNSLSFGPLVSKFWFKVDRITFLSSDVISGTTKGTLIFTSLKASFFIIFFIMHTYIFLIYLLTILV